MDRSNPESEARIVIDDLLHQAGWDISDKSEVLIEGTVYSTENRCSSPQETYNSKIIKDTDEVLIGRADYILLDSSGKPLAIIEAKKRAIEPYVAKQQALPYAKNLGAPFIFLTNGELIYFWDYTQDDARIVNAFYSRRDLERIIHMRSERKPLATIPIPDFYQRQGETREVRPYQKEAMKALDHAIELGKRHFLMELPTGTGKTDLICLYLKRLIESQRAEKILFLVDREQLAKQAIEAIQDILNKYGSYWLKAGTEIENKQITVCLLQTMISRHNNFSSGHFDVVIADECHRSIYGSWQTSLTHFDAMQIGLTATPAAYIERNTYRFYQCKESTPDFSYSIQDAFKDGYLTPYKFASGITEIIAKGAYLDNEYLDPAEFERKWTNEDTNRKMMEAFDQIAKENHKELAPNQKISPGKSIVFAITKSHATRLTKILNDLHPESKGRYAEVITSDLINADEMIRKFKKEEYPQVAVSVDMLTTGFDCREILHIVLCRQVRSAILYQQIRGRGTRLAPHINKNHFVIYDFFENHKYFNDSDENIFSGPGVGRGTTPLAGKSRRDLIELGMIDNWLHVVSYVEVGPDGERIDKKDYVTNWETTIKNRAEHDPIILKVKNGKPLTEEEEDSLTESLNSPEMYFNEENLKNAYRCADRTIIDFIKLALGEIKIKTKEEEITENFQAWLVTKNLVPDQATYLNLLKNRGIAKGKVTIEDLFEPPLSILNAAGKGIELFGEKGLQEIISDMNETIFNSAMMYGN